MPVSTNDALYLEMRRIIGDSAPEEFVKSQVGNLHNVGIITVEDLGKTSREKLQQIMSVALAGKIVKMMSGAIIAPSHKVAPPSSEKNPALKRQPPRSAEVKKGVESKSEKVTAKAGNNRLVKKAVVEEIDYQELEVMDLGADAEAISEENFPGPDPPDEPLTGEQYVEEQNRRVGECLQCAFDLATHRLEGVLTEESEWDRVDGERAAAQTEFDGAKLMLEKASLQLSEIRHLHSIDMSVLLEAQEKVKQYLDEQQADAQQMTTDDPAVIAHTLSKPRLRQHRGLTLQGLTLLRDLIMKQDQVSLRSTVGQCTKLVAAVVSRQWVAREDPQETTTLAQIQSLGAFLLQVCVAMQQLDGFEKSPGLVGLINLSLAVFGSPEKPPPVVKEWGLACIRQALVLPEGWLWTARNPAQIEQLRTVLGGVESGLEVELDNIDFILWARSHSWGDLLPNLVAQRITTLSEAQGVFSNPALVAAFGVSPPDVGTFIATLGGSKAASRPAVPMSLKEVVDRIKNEVGLDAAMPLIPALEAACVSLNVAGANPQAKAAACAKILAIQTNWP